MININLKVFFLFTYQGLYFGWQFLFFQMLFIYPLTAQEIDCDNTVFIATHISTGSGLYRFQVDANEGIFHLETIFENNPDYRMACLGYSVVDKMIYALEFNTYELLRINAFGAITNLGIPRGLDTTLEYYSGEIFPGGRDLFMIGKQKNEEKDVAFYSIDVFDLRATPLAVVSDGAVTVQDMARNPYDGTVYGYDSRQNKMVTVEIGQVNNYQFPSIGEQFTGLFFDKAGNLYGYGDSGGSTSRKFFKIDKISSEVTYIEDGPIGNDGDACGCPYEFDFFKKITPKIAIPCQEITIEYTFHNSSGSARTNLRIFDELPEELTIQSIEHENPSNSFNAREISGVGSNILNLTRIEVLLNRKNTITVKATVNPGAAGLLTSQGVVENLPLALNPNMLSDNVETTDIDDPNFLEILLPESVNFEDKIEYACDNKSATISAPIPSATAFLWSDGSTEPTLEINTPGTYQVQMETDCEIYRDEITVNFDLELPFVDLGANKIVEQGQVFNLPYQSNIQNITQFNWITDHVSSFSCLDCPSPNIQLLSPTTITLQLTDHRGCFVEDEIAIGVNTKKSIYAPTVFSPNRDGINDFFFLQGTNAIINTLKIFDRWGNLVFQQNNGAVNDRQNMWNGDYNGARIDAGVYIWIAQITFADDTYEKLSGTITLIR